MINLDGYEDCIVGVVTRFGAEPILCYDKDKVIEKKMAEGNVDYETALEDFEFNMIGGWFGRPHRVFWRKLNDIMHLAFLGRILAILGRFR